MKRKANGPQLIKALLIGVVLALSSMGARGDQSDSQLPALFDALKQASGDVQAQRVAGQIWQVWLESENVALQKALDAGIAAMSRRELAEAIERFDEVIELDSSFAEGWNKRATALYMDGRMSESMRDIHRTLELEPRHFGAISGMGLIFMSQEDFQSALDAFDFVLTIHPFAPGAQHYGNTLRDRLGQKGS